VFLRWGPDEECCGCVPETIYDSRVGDDVSTASVVDDLCCGCETSLTLNIDGCLGRCCVDGVCTETLQGDCTGDWLGGCCSVGCPVPCCSEDSDGIVQCDTKNSSECSVIANPDCVSGCLGECCIDGVSQGPTTQGDCDSLGGQWAGVGSTTCQGDGDCRQTFSESCCEDKESSAAGLTFTQPRRKRTPPFDGTLRVTVTGTTDSPILIHGTPFGVVGKRCRINHTFLICWDEFHVEPVPCGTNFNNVDLTVCWSQETTPTESLNFSGCNGLTIRLGDYARDCVTTLLYAGSGHTSNSSLVLRNDATISANGTGALVLTTPFSVTAPADITLTLTGTSLHNNSVAAISNPSGKTTSVLKTGSGRWVLSGVSSYTGSTTVEQGELVLGTNASASGQGALGNNPLAALTVGSNVGTAALLLKAGFEIDGRTLTIPAGSQTVILGGEDASIFSSNATVSLGSDVTLQAATGGTVDFNNAWSNGTGRNVTVGTAGNTGTVRFDGVNGFLTTTGTLYVSFGTLSAGAGALPGPAAIVVSSIMDAVDFSGSATLTPTGRATITGAGVSFGDITNNNTTNADALDFTDSGNTLDSLSGNGNTRFRGNVTVKELNGGTIALSSGVVMTVEQGSSSGVISGAGSLVKTTSGTLTLSGANTFSGGTTINGGAMTAGNADAFGTGAITVNAGGTLNKNGFTLPNTITNNGGTVNP
jgi:autotransporter-associated beta strand protein